MPARRLLLLISLLSLAVILSMAVVVDAQDTADLCPTIVSNALTTLGTNCANLGRNASCLGYPEVQHTSFVGTVPADFYTQPGDRVGLDEVETVQTGPFVLSQELWGLNVMNVDANIPYAFSDRGVVFIQFGGVEVENGVEPPEAVQLVDGVNVATTGLTDLLTWPAPSEPGHESEVMTSVPAGTVVSIDAVSPASTFARAVFGNSVGWVSLSALDTSSADLSGLPTIGADDMTPMQNFYFRTGVGGISCEEAPSLLFVQGPESAAVDIRAFEQPIRIESTIILRSLPPGDQLGAQLQLITLSGLAKLYPDTPNEIIVPPGFSSTIPLCSEFESLGIEGDTDEKATCGTWSTPVPLTANDLGACEAVEGLPDNTLYYNVGCPNIIEASGSGGVVPQLFFADQGALDAAIAACQAGELSAEICQYLGIS